MVKASPSISSNVVFNVLMVDHVTRLHTYLLPGPCEECQDWYVRDKAAGTAWLDRVNREFPCPCTVAAAKAQSANWKRDLACYVFGLPLCWKFHPGAEHCRRSVSTTADGARQQCCYNWAGELLRPGHRGAGTPDRSVDDHQRQDVVPFNKCCRECKAKDKNYCDKYIKELRSGNADHCA